MQKQTINIVWLKRDLRLRDHLPLVAAARSSSPCLVVYCFEPSLIAHQDYADRHWRFVYQSLQVLKKRLGDRLLICHRECLEVFEMLAHRYDIKHLWSHLEIGVKLTFDRDLAIQKWCRQQSIRYEEYTQDGVIRGAKSRKGWRAYGELHLSQKPLPDLSDRIALPELAPVFRKELEGPALPQKWKNPNPNFQPGGENNAWRYLHSYLQKRHQNYSRQLGNPSLSRYSCSRMSPYLAYGCISWRSAFYETEARVDQTGEDFNLPNFLSRMYWRTHYLQKFESMCEMEDRAINPQLEEVGRPHDPDLWQAYIEARTGYPMVDASLKCLEETGWVNFRMRAMLVTFASYTLGLDWRQVAHHLARLFLDFEPGIHYAQHQMQAGLTGYHILRIFSPNAQAEKHDPDGTFIHQWIPALQTVPAPSCWKPWNLTAMEQELYQCKIGVDYPAPIVDYERSTKHFKDVYWQQRESPATKAELPAIWERLCIPEDVKKYEG